MAPPVGRAGNGQLLKTSGTSFLGNCGATHFPRSISGRHTSLMNGPEVKTAHGAFGAELSGDMVYFILLMAGNILFAASENILHCSHDYDTLSCFTEAHNCTKLRMTIKKKVSGFESCDGGCCCSVEMVLVRGDSFVAEVHEDEQSVHSQIINVAASFKPQTPFIESIELINGRYVIEWQKNTKRSTRDTLLADVTYWKKGAHTKPSQCKKQSRMEDRNFCEIPDRSLEPNATYVARVQTYTRSGVFSDSSDEVEFTAVFSPEASTNRGLVALILGLSAAAVVVAALAFASFVKLKGKLWDEAAMEERPRLLFIKPNEKAVLTPESVSLYSLSVEPLVRKDSPALSDSSSHTQTVDTGALKNHSPISEKTSFAATAFDNKSYTSAKTDPGEDLDRQMFPTLRDFLILPHCSAVLETDMTYQPCVRPGEASSDSQNLPLVICGNQDSENMSSLAEESQ